MTATAAAERLPPGPSLPPVAQTLAIVASPASFLAGARRRHGDLFTLRLLGVPPFVVACDPDAIRQAFTGPPSVLRAGLANAPLGPLVGPRSVLLLDGEEHLRERRRLLPPFHGERLKAYERIMERATLREVEGWPLNSPFPLLPAMQEITLEVIMRAVLGVAAGDRYEELAARLRRVLDPQGGRVRMVFSLFVEDEALQRRFADRVAAVDELIRAEIADRRGDRRLDRREDVLSMLVQAGLGPRELRDQVVTLLVAGHETTATALAWTFERVLRHSDVLARLREGDDAYLDATVKESLRSRPVVPSVGRVLAEPYEVGGYLLPAGTRLVPSIVLSHAREEAYPDPEAFRPERFLGDGAPSGYEWLPFGGGVRRCLGASFALFEMRVVLRTVLRTARLEADRADPEPTVRSNVTLAPGRGARVIRRAG
ncbi:MAG TPA: cytochrome P450 [Solirubrobacteraceae bacterium]|nr:cytochrome P450 [Solirubrobacteraceae bacterium]